MQDCNSTLKKKKIQTFMMELANTGVGYFSISQIKVSISGAKIDLDVVPNFVALEHT